jgi:putative ATP-dependent endonuclease of OLD family
MSVSDLPAGPQIRKIRIKNYRSIEDWIEIAVPTTTGAPLVLIGENNAGKSNILRALTLVLGERWPGSHNPEDHEAYGRCLDGIELRIHVEVSGLACGNGGCTAMVERFIWRFDKDADKPCEFSVETNGCGHRWVNNALRGALAVMSVGIERDLAWQLSYGSKWTTLSKLMRRFHAQLVEDPNRVERLKGFYKGLVDTFYEVEQFADFAGDLKNATELFGGNLPYGLEIDFSAYDASNFFRSMRVFPHIDGQSRTYEELGTGQEQVLAMAFTYAYAQVFGGEGLVLAVEEPESHLHPLAQQWVASKLRQIAAAGVQVLVTTHSPHFIDLSRPGATVLVRKSSEQAPTTVTQLIPSALVAKLKELGASDATSVENVGVFYENAATTAHKAALFARACVIVEGPTEELGLPELMAQLGIDLIQLGIAVVPAGGVTNIAKWVRYYSAHGIPVYPVFDTDSNKTGNDADQAREARRDIIRSIKLDSELDWNGYVNGPVGVHDSFAVFDSGYETALRACFGEEYLGLETAAQAELGKAKPLVARAAARGLAAPSDHAPNAWDAFRPLAERVALLVAAG